MEKISEEGKVKWKRGKERGTKGKRSKFEMLPDFASSVIYKRINR